MSNIKSLKVVKTKSTRIYKNYMEACHSHNKSMIGYAIITFNKDGGYGCSYDCTKICPALDFPEAIKARLNHTILK